jgi:hypothetical protein
MELVWCPGNVLGVPCNRDLTWPCRCAYLFSATVVKIVAHSIPFQLAIAMLRCARSTCSLNNIIYHASIRNKTKLSKQSVPKKRCKSRVKNMYQTLVTLSPGLDSISLATEPSLPER